VLDATTTPPQPNAGLLHSEEDKTRPDAQYLPAILRAQHLDRAGERNPAKPQSHLRV